MEAWLGAEKPAATVYKGRIECIFPALTHITADMRGELSIPSPEEILQCSMLLSHDFVTA
jgi:hypothetical protein